MTLLAYRVACLGIWVAISVVGANSLAEDDFPPPEDSVEASDPDFDASPPEASPLPESDSTLDSSGESSSASGLPPIEARTYNVKISRLSTSKRVYLFDDLDDAKARVGRILLLKNGEEQIMAFRLLKNYYDRKQFAGSKVRVYNQREHLEIGDSYLGLEKVADLGIPKRTAHERRMDERDLKDLETQMGMGDALSGREGRKKKKGAGGAGGEDDDLGEGDPDLDGAGGAPFNAEEIEKSESEEEDALARITVDEVKPLDVDKTWLSGMGGLVNNAGDFYMGFGLKYGTTLKHMLAMKRKNKQDSLVLEGSVYLYKVILPNVGADNEPTGTNASFTVLPIVATIRYNIFYAGGFGFFVYGGFGKNLVLTSTNDTEDIDESGTGDGTERLSGFVPAFGGGAFVQVGPRWQVRLDIGYDFVGAGIVLRY
ncbi:MAG: hypothetical protein AB7P04_01475 [Bacteriovoracia bacterium]